MTSRGGATRFPMMARIKSYTTRATPTDYIHSPFVSLRLSADAWYTRGWRATLEKEKEIKIVS
jgi:hypothetical protein